MKQKDKWFSHLTKEVVSGAFGYKLDAYLIALEGWRRGLTLRWYAEETNHKSVKKVGKNFHGRIFSLSSSNSEIHYFFRSRGDKTDNRAVDICKDKELTKQKLTHAGVPNPQGKEFERNTLTSDLITFATEIGFPVVLKPTKGSLGKGVYTNIQNHEELEQALADFYQENNFDQYIIEKYVSGNEYRFYVVGDKVIGATNRIPANIIGDGINNIKTLIDIKNSEKKKNPYLKSKSIEIDYEVRNHIEQAGYTMESVLNKNEQLFLRSKSNLSAGGDPIDATDELSEEVKQIAVDAIKAIPKLYHGGVDIIVDPSDERKGTVLEVNATAEIGFHVFPMRGTARDVPGAVVDFYFPETTNLRKSTYFFDYKSILEPLSTGAAKEVEVTPAIMSDIVSKKYYISGKVQGVGYRNWIKKQAIKKNLSGYVKNLKNGKVLVVISGTPEKVEEFKTVLKKGSPEAKVENVTERIYENPVKIGFEIKNTTNLSNKDKNEKKDNQKIDQLEQFEKKYTNIVNSRTWRYTAPLRKVLRKLKSN